MKIKLSCIETHILTIESNVGRYERLKNELNCLEDKLKIMDYSDFDIENNKEEEMNQNF